MTYKNNFRDIIRRAAITLLLAVMTATTAWAQHQPVGDVVYCHVYPYAEGLISLMGWAYDPDAPSTSISVRYEVYTDQNSQNLVKTENIRAFDGNVTYNVPELEGLTGNHGFDGYITDLTVGTTYWIKVFAIDATGDGEVQIGTTQEITVIPRVEYGLKVGDIEVTSLNRDDIYQDRIRGYLSSFPSREPTASYDPDTHTLTLNEPDDENCYYSIFDGDDAAIESDLENLTIAGSWHMKSSWASLFKDKRIIYSYTDCSLTFDGDFTFLAEGDNNHEAIYCLGNVNIKSNSRITISCENNTALWCAGTLTMENGVDYLEMHSKGNIVLVGALSLGDQLTIVEPVGGKVFGTNICTAEGDPTDHIVIEDLNYALPATFTVNTTATTATVSWPNPVTNYTYTGYAYRFKKKEDANWSDEVITTENSVTLNGLSSNTDYEFRLRVLYASERRSYASKSFNTPIVLPYEMGFEDGLDRWKMVNCNFQENYNNTSSNLWTGIRTCAKHEGTCGFQFGSNYAKPQASQYLISPGLPSTIDLSVSFYYKNNSSPMSFRVGYSSTTDDIDAFTWGNVTTISNAQWTKYEGILPAGTKYMAIEWIYVSGDDFDNLYLDDIRLTATLMLADGNDNTTAVNNANGETVSVTFQDRTLYTDGDWNTLTLPFAMTSAQIATSPLAGSILMELDGSSSNLTDDILTLNFTNATSIEAGKPYIVKWQDGVNVTINSTADWNAFAESVNGGMSFAGKTVLLGADIDVSTMAGTSEHPFSGTFEGAGHTMNVSISGGGDGAAPFRYINGATIRNVKTTGTVSGGNHSAGLVGIALGGTNSIRDCHVAATVSTSESYVGGIVGNGTTSATTISNCLFGGSLSASNIGILYGWGEDGGTHTVENCVANGSYAYGSIDLLLGDGNCTVTNCWKNTNLGLQGNTNVYIYMGSGPHPIITGYLGSQWTYEDGFVLSPTVNVIDTDIENPVFTGVTIDATEPKAVTFDGGSFVGQYDPFVVPEANRYIMLGTENTLGYAAAGKTLRPFRAHFEVPTGTNVKAYKMKFGEDDATGIISPISIDNGKLTIDNVNDGWYDMSGRKLEGKPTKKGIYINNGRKVAIK